MTHLRGRPRGVSIVYTVVVLSVMLLFCSLGVDLARVQVAKTEVRRAVDDAARHGAGGFAVDYKLATQRAMDVPDKNTVDGKKFSFVQSEDIVVGKWDANQRKFTPLTGWDRANADAIQVTGRRTKARGTAIPLTFASVLGMKTANINGMTAIAQYVPGVNVDQKVPATANPFLSGMPKGTMASPNNPHNSPDYAGDSNNPKQSPLQVNMLFSPGEALAFDSISGDARHDPNLAYYSPDGQLNSIGTNTAGDEHGIKGLRGPINALVGVFLGPDQPSKTPVPTFTLADLDKCPTDFSTSEARNKTVYQPKLKQMFFIGDGLTDTGQTQSWIAPPGATRLYLATWDFYEWNNNAGSRNVKVYRPGKVRLVK
jgi:Flp pilus assembly protein TadG